MNERGEKTTTLRVPKNKPITDIIFRYTVSDDTQQFDSWALEISEPKRGNSHRIGSEGILPPLIHWDGMFSSGYRVLANEKYFIRLLLTTSDQKVVGSPWSFFTTKVKRAYDKPRVDGNLISLYVLPSGGVHGIFLKTTNFQSAYFPSLYGDIRFIWKNKHTFGLRFETTSNILSQYDRRSNGFVYSDFSLVYKYLVFGAPIKAPLFPAIPNYDPSLVKEPQFRVASFQSPQNFELGIRQFNIHLRGLGNTVIEYELARVVRGLAVNAYYDRLFSSVRLSGTLEGGYTLFRGAMVLLSGEVAVVYEGFAEVSPGFQLRMQRLSGSPAADQPNASEKISNQVIFAGLLLHFRI